MTAEQRQGWRQVALEGGGAVTPIGPVDPLGPPRYHETASEHEQRIVALRLHRQGIHKVLDLAADEIDGHDSFYHSAPPRQRPAVNPWRHVATRQRHFARAAGMLMINARANNCEPRYYLSGADYWGAFENCGWGT